MSEAPFTFDWVIGRNQAQKVANAGRKHVLLALEVVAFTRKAAKRS